MQYDLKLKIPTEIFSKLWKNSHYMLLRSLLVLLFSPIVVLFAQQVSFPNTDFLFEMNKIHDNSYEFEFKLDQITLSKIYTKNQYFTSVSADGFYEKQDIGKPALPQFNELMETPNGGKVKITIKNASYQILNLNQLQLPKIIPHQRSISKSEDPSKVNFELDQKYYAQNKFVSQDLVTIKTKGIIRKRQMSRLEICPFEYDPSSNLLRVYHNIKFQIEFLKGDLTQDRLRNSAYNQLEFSSLFSRFINFDNGITNKDFITSYPTTYVIVSDRSFEQVLQPFVDWKSKKGFHVIEAYTDNPNVGNTTTSIKNYLQNLYNNPGSYNPPSYILLVGDVNEIPSFSGTQGNHISDLYYAEYDGNGDFYADVYYGRFSSSNPQEIQHMVSKTIDYEMYNFQDPSFLGNAVMISGVDAVMAPTYGNGQINYANQYYTNSTHGINSHTYLYPASGSSASQILTDVNNGCAIANYTAHGYSQGWADPGFTCADVHNMTNFGKLPLMIGNCCLSNKFDDPECFGEALLRVSNKGAIGYIGGSNNTYWNEDYWFAVGNGSILANPTYNSNNLGFFDRLFHANGEPETEWFISNAQIMMGGNLAVTQAGGADDYYNEIYHLMGDPSLMTYLGIPSALSVQHDQVIPLGLSIVDIISEEGAYVSISQNGITLNAGLTSSTGSISLDISGMVNMDSLYVVVTKQNKIPYMGAIQIMPPNGVFISNSNNVFNEVLGNFNGEIDFGETHTIDATLKNFGNVDAAGVFAKLSSTNPYLTLLSDSSHWGSILAGQSIQNTSAFKIDIADNTPDQEVIQLLTTIEDNQNNNWSTYFNIKVNSPNTSATNLWIEDNQFGNDNGRLDPGEIVSIYFPTKNSGHADHVNLITNLTSSHTGIQFFNSSVNLDSLAVSTTEDAIFNAVIDSSISYGTPVTFTYDIIDGGYVNQQQFTLIVGLIVEDFDDGGISTSGWTNNYSFPWIHDSQIYYSNNYSLTSSNSTHNTSSILELNLNVTEQSDLQFMKKVSSESGYDFLKFFIDNVEIDSWSGEDDWSLQTYSINPGNHQFKWQYTKDFSVSSGLDAAWIDDVVFPIVNTGNNLNSLSFQINDLKIYPNPVKDILHIKSNNEIHTIAILSLTGRLIDTFTDLNTKSVQIPTNNLNSGYYIFQFETSNGVLNKNIIVSK